MAHRAPARWLAPVGMPLHRVVIQIALGVPVAPVARAAHWVPSGEPKQRISAVGVSLWGFALQGEFASAFLCLGSPPPDPYGANGKSCAAVQDQCTGTGGAPVPRSVFLFVGSWTLQYLF